MRIEDVSFPGDDSAWWRWWVRAGNRRPHQAQVFLDRASLRRPDTPRLALTGTSGAGWQPIHVRGKPNLRSHFLVVRLPRALLLPHRLAPPQMPTRSNLFPTCSNLLHRLLPMPLRHTLDHRQDHRANVLDFSKLKIRANKTQGQPCKRLAWPIIPHSWSGSVSPINGCDHFGTVNNHFPVY